MKPIENIAQELRRLRLATPTLTSDEAHEAREARPFYFYLTVILMLVYGQAVYTSPELRTPVRLILFSGLMLLHLVLHWLSPRFAVSLRWSLSYFAVQGALAFVLVIMASGLGLLLGLFAALIGEAVGILRNTRPAAVVTLYFLGLLALSLSLVTDWETIVNWLVVIVLTLVSVVIFVVLFNRQADARARAQTLLGELETAHRQLAAYAAQVEDLTLAAERQRMARELHDTLAQGVAGLILQLEAAKAHLAAGHSERAQTIVEQAMARARATLADARRAIGDLRETQTMRDLAAAVRDEVERFTTATGIPCALDLALPAALPKAIREHAQRIVTEGLTNVARHAQAGQVWMRLGRADGLLEIEIRDDGIGFDPAAAVGQAGHYGLLGMRERARLSGGTLEITSAPGAGTTLRLHLPLNSPTQGATHPSAGMC